MELLIAMFVFSIIAVMLVPNVTQNAEKELFATQIKKVQNDVQQALLLMMAKHQNTLVGLFSASPSHDFINDTSNGLRSHLETKVVFNHADGGAALDAGEAYRGYVEREPQYLNGANAGLAVNRTASFEAIRLKNGATISAVFNSSCTNAGNAEGYPGNGLAAERTCGYLEIDTNSEKSPNIVGKDIHYFWILDKDGLVPFGELADGTSCGGCTSNVACPSGSFPQTQGDNANLGCTARVLNRGSIDYY